MPSKTVESTGAVEEVMPKIVASLKDKFREAQRHNSFYGEKSADSYVLQDGPIRPKVTQISIDDTFKNSIETALLNIKGDNKLKKLSQNEKDKFAETFSDSLAESFARHHDKVSGIGNQCSFRRDMSGTEYIVNGGFIGERALSVLANQAAEESRLKGIGR